MKGTKSNVEFLLQIQKTTINEADAAKAPTKEASA
jgi:hypothetical protein